MRNQGLFSDWFSRFFRKPPVTPPVKPPGTWLTQEMLDLHNNVRQSALMLNNKLNFAAQKHAEWMANNNVMSHTGEDRSSFWTRIKQTGYNPQTGGENIAMGHPNVSAVFNGWMHSSGHYANIVNRSYKEVGFGIATSKNGSKYWCADFGAPMSEGMFYVHLENSFPGPLSS